MNKRKLLVGLASVVAFLSLGAVTQKASADVRIANTVEGKIFKVAVANSVGDNYGDTDFKEIRYNTTATWWRNSKEGALINLGRTIYFVSSNFYGAIIESEGKYYLYSMSTFTRVPHIDREFYDSTNKGIEVSNKSNDGNPFYAVTLSKFGTWDKENNGDATNGNAFSLYAPWFATIHNSHTWIRNNKIGGSILGVNGSRYYYVHPGDSLELRDDGVAYNIKGYRAQEVYMYR